MGLTGKITPDQVSKKWDNLKTKFKVEEHVCDDYQLELMEPPGGPASSETFSHHFVLCLQDLKFPPRGMENQTNPASWPWFHLMNDALEGRLVDKAPKVTPVWSNEEDAVFGPSCPAAAPAPPAPADRDCLMADSVSELESMVEGDHGESDANITYIDASGEECLTPTDLSYKSKTGVCVCVTGQQLKKVLNFY